MDKIAVLIPCYNESKTIKRVINDFKRQLPDAKIYVYDNNSNDGSDVIAKEAGAIVKYEKKQGKGNVIRSMFQDINAKCYIIVDGDDTYPVGCVNKMSELILKNKADMVIGDRLSLIIHKGKKNYFRYMGNIIIRKIINKIYKSEIKDVLTGYRAFNYDFVKNFPAESNGFEVETEMTMYALKNNMNIENVMINYRNRPKGSKSKIRYIDGIKIILNIYKNHKN